MVNTRKVAFEALMKLERDSSYSNLTLDSFLNNFSELEGRDKSFISVLFYGVIERKLTLDYNLSLYLNKPLSKLKPEAVVILRLGAYQLLFMDKIPASAAVNESVKLSKKYCSYASGIINAVLRKIHNNGLKLADEKNSAEYLSVKYSCEKWICEKWIREYGYKDAEQILAASTGAPDVFIRVNTLKTTADELISELTAEGVDCKKTYLDNAIKISLNGKDIESLTAYKNGKFHVQDLASQLCVKALSPEKGETVFDLCSAPGGKAYTAAEYMRNEGKLLCFDKYEKRVELIKKGAERLGITVIHGDVSDALIHRDDLGKADKVLCDVPCAGLGIIRRKPEIKYKSKESLAGLPDIQLKILKNAAEYVKPNGRLVYSTCSLSKDENENVCNKFLESNIEFTAVTALEEISSDAFITLMPHKNGSDGFFIACFEKKE